MSERYTSFEHGGEVFQSFARSTKHRFQRHQYQGGSGESRGGCVQLAAAATGNGELRTIANGAASGIGQRRSKRPAASRAVRRDVTRRYSLYVE